MRIADLGGMHQVIRPFLFGGTGGDESSLEALSGILFADLDIVESCEEFIDACSVVSLCQLFVVVICALQKLTSHELVVATGAASELVFVHVARHEVGHVDGLCEGIDGLLREGASLDTLLESDAKLKDGHLAIHITVHVNAIVELLSGNLPINVRQCSSRIVGVPAGHRDSLDLLSPVGFVKAFNAFEGSPEAGGGVILADFDIVQSLH